MLAFDPTGFDCGGYLFEAHRVCVAEGEVFKFAAHLAHAETMSQRGVDVESFACNRFLPIGLQVLESTHIMEAVGQLDENHANIGDHGQQHLAHVFGLAVFAVGELDLVDLGDTFNNVRHLIAKTSLDFFAGGGGVFHGVVEESGGDGGGVHLHLREHLCNFKGMNDVGLAGSSNLAFMVLNAEIPGFADETDIFTGTVRLNAPEQSLKALIDQGLFRGARSRRGLPGRARGGAGHICR